MGRNIPEASEEKQEEMMRMTRRSPAHMRPVVDAAPRSNVVQPDKEARPGGGFTALLESAAQQILAVTYWFDPVPHPGPYAVTVRFSGRRIDVKGRLQPGDRFVQDETIEEVVPGSGPISLTTRVRSINPGEWLVSARLLGSAYAGPRPTGHGDPRPVAGRPRPIARV